MSEIQCLLLYAGVWGLFLLYFIKKSKHFGLGESLLATYFLSAITSLFFYETRSLIQAINIQLPALLYVQICSFLIIYPFLFYSKELSTLTIKEYYRFDKLYPIFQLLLPFVALVTIEYIYGALSTNSDTLGDVYEASFDSGGKESIGYQLSGFNSLTFRQISRFYYLWPILLFECLRRSDKMRKMAVVPLLCILSLLLSSYCAAARVGIVKTIMYVVLVFFFYKNSLDKNTYRKVLLIGTWSGGLLVALLALISLSRFAGLSRDVTMSEWLSLYMGEGIVRFSDNVWDLTRTSDGDTSFSLIRSLLGLDTFTDYYERRDYYEMYFGIPTNIFYTFVGDWYQDLGRFLTPVLCVAVSFVEYKILRKTCKNQVIGMGSVLFLGLISYFVMFGFMYFVFKVYGSQITILQSSIALFFLIKFISR